MHSPRYRHFTGTQYSVYALAGPNDTVLILTQLCLASCEHNFVTHVIDVCH